MNDTAIHEQQMQCPKCRVWCTPLRDGEVYRSPCHGEEIKMFTRAEIRGFRRGIFQEEAMHGGSP